jgi:predicted nucleotidyltransferase
MVSASLLRQVQRKKVAKEAAWLLYRQIVTDYLSAKQAAARNLKMRILPTNAQVAEAVDALSTQIEGPARDQLLISLRQHALQVMHLLHSFHPRLIGSVWRGTARRGSDIDLEAFCDAPQLVITCLQTKYPDLTQALMEKTTTGRTDRFLHVSFPISSTCIIDINVKRQDMIYMRRICEVYNDVITGLTYTQLQKVLDKDPLQRFLPKEK